jgi:hypothetical protein
MVFVVKVEENVMQHLLAQFLFEIHRSNEKLCVVDFTVLRDVN